MSQMLDMVSPDLFMNEGCNDSQTDTLDAKYEQSDALVESYACWHTDIWGTVSPGDSVSELIANAIMLHDRGSNIEPHE